MCRYNMYVCMSSYRRRKRNKVMWIHGSVDSLAMHLGGIILLPCNKRSCACMDDRRWLYEHKEVSVLKSYESYEESCLLFSSRPGDSMTACFT